MSNKAWFPYRCICRICRVSRKKKIHRTDITLWKPPVQMLNTKEMTDTTCCTTRQIRLGKSGAQEEFLLQPIRFLTWPFLSPDWLIPVEK